MLPIFTSTTDLACIIYVALKHNLGRKLVKNPTIVLYYFIQQAGYFEESQERMAALALLRTIPNLKVNEVLHDCGNTLLHTAVHARDLELVRALLAAGANPNEVFHDCGNTLLHTAVHARDLELVRTLLAAGANPNVFNISKETPLYIALTKNKTHKPACHEMIALLLKNGADVNTQNTHKAETVLHWAVCAGEVKIAEILLRDFNAYPYIQNTDRMSPLYLAIERGYTKMVHMMLKKGANGKSLVDPNHCHENISIPPLHWARFNREHVIARLLTLYGANPKNLSSQGETADDIAAYNSPQPVPGTLPSVGIVQSGSKVQFLKPSIKPLMSSSYKPTQPVPTHLAGVGIVNSCVLTLTRKYP